MTSPNNTPTVEAMTEFQINTPSGVSLAGDLVRPVDSHDAVVIFAHGFLSDRYGDGWFDPLARRFRSTGYATCAFDMSGCGLSQTLPITVTAEELDLRAVSNWLYDQGLTRQVIYAHGFGAKVALSARPRNVAATVCTFPLVHSQTFDWSAIFSDEQLEQLDRHGECTIADDLTPLRSSQIVSRETLNDVSQTNAGNLFNAQDCPVLLLVGDGPEHEQMLSACRDNFHLLCDGSRVITLPSHYATFGSTNSADPETAHIRKQIADHVSELVLKWLRNRVPAKTV